MALSVLLESVTYRHLEEVVIDSFLEESWMPHPSIVEEIEQEWLEMVSDAEKQGKLLFSEPGTLLRVGSMWQEGPSLKIKGQPTEYKYHALTRKEQDINKRANPLYVGANIITSDGYLVYGVRGKMVERGAGQIGIIAGSVNPKKHMSSDKSSLDMAIYNEIEEETGILAEDLEFLNPSFVSVDKVSKPNELYPSLIYGGLTRMDRKAVEEVFKEEEREFSNLHFIRFRKTSITKELANNRYRPREQIILAYLSHNL